MAADLTERLPGGQAASALAFASARLVEARLDQLADGLERLARLRSGGGDVDRAALLRRQHHDSHDAAAVHALAVLADRDLGLEAIRGLHQEHRGASVQAEPVLDLQGGMA